MIDMTKQYTYQGKAVRIYADGSDTDNSTIHGAYKSETSGRWVLNIFNDSELVEVWEPTNGDIGSTYKHCTKFTGDLPEAFKGL